MNTTSMTVPVTGCTPADLTLPQPLSDDALALLEDEIARRLRRLRDDLRGGAGRDAAAIEYASWQDHLS